MGTPPAPETVPRRPDPMPLGPVRRPGAPRHDHLPPRRRARQRDDRCTPSRTCGVAAPRDPAADAGRRHRAGRALTRRRDPGRVGGLHGLRAAAVRCLGGLPLRDLVAADLVRPAATGPLQHLPAGRRLLHGVRAAPARRPRQRGDARHRLVHRPPRRHRTVRLAARAAVAVPAALRRRRLGCAAVRPGPRRRRVATRRRRRRRDPVPARGRRRALRRGRRRLLLPATRPVAPLVRLPRGLPRLHRARLRQSLRGRLGGHPVACAEPFQAEALSMASVRHCRHRGAPRASAEVP